MKIQMVCFGSIFPDRHPSDIFIKKYQTRYRITSMCKILKVHRCGFYAWLHNSKSNREKEDDRLYELIYDFWEDSYQTYGNAGGLAIPCCNH